MNAPGGAGVDAGGAAGSATAGSAGAPAAAGAAPSGGAPQGTAGSGVGGAASGDWWDAGFGHRRHIEVDNGAGTEALEAVPILVTLDSTRISYADAAADGHDLRFVGSDGAVLSHEIESWDAAGTSVVWLKLPLLPGPGKAAFDLYYGNAQAPVLPATHAQDVWSADYIGVWHLAENGNDATGAHDSGDAKTTYVAGPHGKAASFDGATQYVDLPGMTKYVAALPAVTFSGWVKHAGTQPDGKGIIIGIGTEVATGHASWTSVTFGDGWVIGEANPEATNRGEAPSGAGSFPANEWSYFTVVIDIAGKKIQDYKAGAPVGETLTGAWSATAFQDLASDRAAIGAEEDRGPHWFHGELDEIRAERGARSPAWIAAQGQAVKGDWLSVGPDQARP